MENKPAQNIQDTFLNTIRKDKTPITIYLVSGVKLTGKIRSFDKYSVLLENNSQEQLIFKHAISTVVSNRGVMHTEHRPAAGPVGIGPASVSVPAAISSTLPEPTSVAGSGRGRRCSNSAATTPPALETSSRNSARDSSASRPGKPWEAFRE